MRVFIGYDASEEKAFKVAKASLLRHASIPVEVIPLHLDTLSSAGLLRRPVDARGGELYDFHSNAYQSTEFAISRFLVPLLAQSGLALFCDCDVVFLDDVKKVFDLADPLSAVQVVKHQYVPKETNKMAGKTQSLYPYKNWSSVMLINADHRGNKRLSLDALNHRPGRDLHAFFWLSDSEIGELPAGWNWLVDEEPKPDPLFLAHYTNGGPWLPDWISRESDDLWLREEAHDDLG